MCSLLCSSSQAFSPLVLEWWTNEISLAALHQFGRVLRHPHPAERGFDLTGLVVIGYTVFAYALGATLGAVIRKPGWAFASGVAVFVFARLAIQQWVRPALVASATVSSLNGFSMNAVTNGWLLNEGILPTGQTFPSLGATWDARPPARLSSCLDAVKAHSAAGYSAAEAHCATLAHVHYVIQYQPASHYWALQGAETAIFLGMAFALLAVAAIAVRQWRA